MNRPAVTPGARVVVKVGSSSLAYPDGGINDGALERVVRQVSEAWDSGYPTVLVTSAAVAAGLPVLGLKSRPTELASYQVAAAVGQVRLMERYDDAFAAHDKVVGQVLLTKDVLANREQYVRSRAALDKMLELGIVPVVNENDTVVVDELKLGDNDRLAAIVSHLASAARLILLTDTDGLYSDDPRVSETAELLTAVQHTDEVLDELARGVSGPLGRGGVATKVAAARMAAWSGVPTVIANSAEPDVVKRAIMGDDVGTWVAPRRRGLSARRLWIAFGVPTSGRIEIDEGAARALAGGNGSLLAVGVTGAVGDFGPGAAVEVVAPGERLVAKGIARMGADAVRAVAGKRSDDLAEAGVVVHRDDLVVLGD